MKKPTYRKDYSSPSYTASHINLFFDLGLEKTRVKATTTIKATPGTPEKTPCFLHGEELELLSVKIDGTPFKEYEVDSKGMTFVPPGPTFELEIENMIFPEKNTSLQGLYASGSILCTQNESQGMRKITYSFDRPDVMSTYTTTIEACQKTFPTLLSNGNLMKNQEEEGGRHQVTWEDPFPKPPYLYALVAGELGVVKSIFKTKSGKSVDLHLYCDPGREDQCDYALESLKKAMTWDEERFNLEYDLDLYMIVAVDAFNMGAMENKGLNIFNSSCILARPEISTDHEFLRIEKVVGHEYFHNWTGNRVTCRDWFQLTLKEGLTVFRDQEFSADMNSPQVERIKDVKILKENQFPEDAGPMSHPIRPDSYLEMDNFYTSTVYEKGAEVVRMIQTLLGKENFCRGLQKYLELFDGKAATVEDFLYGMSVANNNYDFLDFKKWYSEKGTPTVKVKTSYDKKIKEFRVELTQKGTPTPMVIPLRFGLVGENGDEPNQEELLVLTQKEKTFSFKNIPSKPILSINRGFSAPVRLKTDLTQAELSFLACRDSDPFNRYEAFQELSHQVIQEIIVNPTDPKDAPLDLLFFKAFESILLDPELDHATRALTLLPPSPSSILQRQKKWNIEKTYKAWGTLQERLGERFSLDLLSLYEGLERPGDHTLQPERVGERQMRHSCLSLLLFGGGKLAQELAWEQFSKATNMTERFNALSLLAREGGEVAEKALSQFYQDWKDFPLAIQKWMKCQAASHSDYTYERVLELEKNALYNPKVPNWPYSLIFVFARNLKEFNHPSGRGYKLTADRIITFDRKNPSVASSLSETFRNLKRTPPHSKKLPRRNSKGLPRKNSPPTPKR